MPNSDSPLGDRQRPSSGSKRNDQHDAWQPITEHDKDSLNGEADDRAHRAIWQASGAGSPPDSLSFMIDAEKSRFEQADLIDEGANGVVYLYTSRPSGRKLAAKLVNVEINHGRFLEPTEYVLLKKHLKRHPNIIDLHACFLNVGTGEALIVMDFCAGGSVKDLLEKHDEPGEHISKGFLIHFIASMTAAFGFLHEGLRYGDDGKTVQRDPMHRTVVHRDVKLANILLRSHPDSDHNLPHVVLADFGSAQLTPAGTPGVSPESVGASQQIGPDQMEQRVPNPTSDIYAFGSCICRLLYGGLGVMDGGPGIRDGRLKGAYETSGLEGTAFSLRTLRRCLSVGLQERPSTEELFFMGRRLKEQLTSMANNRDI